MKFTCLKDKFAKGLSIATKAVPLKHSLPILTNVLIEIENGRIKLTGSDFDNTIVTYVGASVEEEGSTTVPAKLLNDIISNINSEQLSVESVEDILTITAGKSKSKLNGVPATDYPKMPQIQDYSQGVPDTISISPKDLNTAISKVGFCVATDSSRMVFTGILIKFEDDTLTFAASDGVRLSEYIVPASGDVESFSVVVPAKTLLEIGRIFSSEESEIIISLSDEDNLLSFKGEDTYAISRILHGDYPDYKKIIPTDSNLTLTVNKADLYDAIKLTNVFVKNGLAKDSSENVVKLQVSDGNIKVMAMSQEVGENYTDVVSSVEGDALDIMFDITHLLDLLTNYKEDTLIIKITDPKTPCLFVPEAPEVKYLHILSPVQPND